MSSCIGQSVEAIDKCWNKKFNIEDTTKMLSTYQAFLPSYFSYFFLLFFNFPTFPIFY
jgi:hypothetical protein